MHEFKYTKIGYNIIQVQHDKEIGYKKKKQIWHDMTYLVSEILRK